MIKVSSLLVYGQGGNETHLRPKYKGKIWYFILQLIGFFFKISREYEILFSHGDEVTTLGKVQHLILTLRCTIVATLVTLTTLK